MILVARSALVAHSAHEMYALVADGESSPEFLPWCGRAICSVNEPGPTVATLHINFHGLKKEFTTENVKQPGVRIDMTLVTGPFRSLEGSWLFIPLSEKACKVEFKLRYQFASVLVEKAAGSAFQDITDTFVDAFVRRADEKFGGA